MINYLINIILSWHKFSRWYWQSHKRECSHHTEPPNHQMSSAPHRASAWRTAWGWAWRGGAGPPASRCPRSAPASAASWSPAPASSLTPASGCPHPHPHPRLRSLPPMAPELVSGTSSAGWPGRWGRCTPCPQTHGHCCCCCCYLHQIHFLNISKLEKRFFHITWESRSEKSPYLEMFMQD